MDTLFSNGFTTLDWMFSKPVSRQTQQLTGALGESFEWTLKKERKEEKSETCLKSFQNIFYFIALVLFPTLPRPYCCTQSLQGYGADSILQQNR